MLKREDLKSENIDQIVADAHKAGYHFFLSSAEREASFKAALARYQPGEEVWVFAYGSLIWNPACAVEETCLGLALGWHRAFRLRLTRWRGTKQQPGLMLVLDRGGRCKGLLQRLPRATAVDEMDLLLPAPDAPGAFLVARYQPMSDG